MNRTRQDWLILSHRATWPSFSSRRTEGWSHQWGLHSEVWCR